MDDTKKKIFRSEFINKKVERALLYSMYKQAFLGFIASIICATVVFIYLFYSDSKNNFLFLWYAVILLTTLLRVILVRKFLSFGKKIKKINPWKILFIVGVFLNGITWGLTGTSLLIPLDKPLSQAFILMILAGLSSGSVSLNAYIPSAAITFIITTLTPLFIHFLLMDDPIYLLFSFIIIIFSIYLIALSFNINHIIRHSLYLQFENSKLLIKLLKSKNKLEIINKNLKKTATLDPLTHVANRHLFEITLHNAIEKAKVEGKNIALLYLDLDKFKDVNDNFGHHVGDKLLLVVITRIKNILREHDTVARLGGDELTIILENATHFETIADIANRICQSIAKPIRIDNIEAQVYASIGISMYPSDASTMEELIEIADKAMYFTKESGGNSFHFNVQKND